METQDTQLIREDVGSTIIDMIQNNPSRTNSSKIGMNWNPNTLHLQGTVRLTKSDLEKMFPHSRTHSPVGLLKDTKHITIYGRNIHGNILREDRLAYHCKKCDTLVLGPPDITQVNLESTTKPVTHYEITCKVCCSQLGTDPYQIEQRNN